ncbi:TonB-dependent receptor plug domain-containing protein [Phenylobacterium parvum]|uniref:TonB-dependent receptor n=1 Tax=Phenylobacterium parvum TaxID=2201350 RepID=A0A2Z3HZF1_9CAUL|nr:TonB-dependent receptor [Phenylobacterium parvum]AWM76584.1 TonB-dependent receptor [Phenylobacterium parvum]
MAFRHALLRTTVISGLAALAFAPSALAQEATDVDELVVTGSRIKSSAYTSASPIQVITGETQTLQGLVDTAEVLQRSSLASGSFQVNNQLTGFVTTGGPGVNTINLRGLGSNRNLVLLNGRRVGPAGTRGTVGPVDLNVIPQSVVNRIEILKDGASSIYGSDAIAGVTNIITNDRIDGGEVQIYGNMGEQRGGETFRINGTWGKTFDRGYLNISGDYYEQKVLRREDRDDTACAADYLVDPATGQRVDYKNTEGGTKCYNLFANTLRTGSFGDLVYTLPGITYPTAAQGNAGSNATIAVPAGFARSARAGFPLTYPYAEQEDPLFGRASILSPVKRYTIYATAGIDLTPNIEGYTEVLLNRRESAQYGVRQFFPSLATAWILGNPNNPYGASLGSQLPIIPMKSDRAQTVDYARVLFGMKGDISGLGFLDGWSWDAFVQHSRSDADYGVDVIYNDRVLAVTTGALACDQTRITISGGQCSSIPTGIPLTSQRVLAGNFNAAESAFLFGYEIGNTVYEQTQFEASMTGDLFQLPAGGVGTAIGVSYRKDRIDDQPGINERSGNFWGSSSAGRTRGGDTVKEVFAEFNVPVLSGVRFVEALDLTLSGRYTDYESYGSNETYKVGLNWAIAPWLKIRASDGTSFRAPALYELYLANQTSFLGQTSVDPCIRYEESSNEFIRTNCAAAGVPQGYTAAGTSSATIVTGGGAGVLEAETSKARTFGIVFTPKQFDLSVAVDYFEIEVNDEVRQFGASNITFQCYSRQDFPNNPYCGLITRATGATPQITTINNSYVNVASQKNRGIDLNIRYVNEFDFGRLQIEGEFTWQLEDKTQLLGSSTVEDFNGTTYGYDGPDFTGNVNARFSKNDWTVFWGMNIIGKGSDTGYLGRDEFLSTRYSTTCRNSAGAVAPCTTLLASAATAGGLTVIGTPILYKQYTEFYMTHDLTVRKRMDKWTLQGGVQNLFDERPPAGSAGQFRIGTAALNGYDMVGRSVFLRAGYKW